MQLVKLQCAQVSYVLMNDAGDYSPVLTNEQVTMLLNGSIRAEDVPTKFSGLRPSCPVMENQTVHIIPRVKDNAPKAKDTSPKIAIAVDATVKSARKFVSEDKK
jgi:hypothetical protein